MASGRNTRWRQRKLTQTWECLKHWTSTREHWIYCLYLDTAHTFVYMLHMFLTGYPEADVSCAEIWKTWWIYWLWVLYFSSPQDNLIIYFSQIKCALCSHLRTSCKSLWLVYTPVYSSCRVLSPLLSRGRWAITPFKELFSWKLPRVYVDHFPQST